MFLLMRQVAQAPATGSGVRSAAAQCEGDGLLSFYSATGFSRFLSKVLSRGKRTDQPGSGLILADKRDSR